MNTIIALVYEWLLFIAKFWFLPGTLSFLIRILQSGERRVEMVDRSKILRGSDIVIFWEFVIFVPLGLPGLVFTIRDRLSKCENNGHTKPCPPHQE